MAFDVKAKEMAILAISGFGAMQKVGELSQLLVELIRSRPKVVVEIGAGKGGTAWVWSKLASVGQVVSIDLPGGPWGGGDISQMVSYVRDSSYAKYSYIPGNSQAPETYERLVSELGGQGIDFLFIDGDHSYEGVKADYERYKDLVRVGGIIGFHDICEHPPEAQCHVHEFWEELKKDNPGVYAELIEEPASWGGIGLVRVE